jgi:hypothetical protein
MKPINTIEELLKSRQRNPVFTLKCAKDIAKRIKKLEGAKK